MRPDAGTIARRCGCGTTAVLAATHHDPGEVDLSKTAPRILKLGSAGFGDPVRLQRAAALGFDFVMLPADAADLLAEENRFAGMVAAARAAGLGLILDCELDRLPLDHRLVVTNPLAFAIRRSADTSAPIDPRKPALPRGIARARFRHEPAQTLLGPLLAKGIARLAEAGIAGIRIGGLAGAPPAFWGQIVAALKAAAPEAIAIANTPGLPREDVLALGECGFDYFVSSLAWWDRRARWLIEEHQALAPIAPLLAELRTVPENAAELRIAAASAAGVILPETPPELDDEVRSANELAASAAAFGGEMRALSPAGSPLTALLRVPSASVREASGGLLVLINRGDAPAGFGPELLAGAGTDFAAIEAGELAPGEVRTLTLERGRRITRRPSAAKTGASGAARKPRLVIEGIAPAVSGGPFPVRRIVGEVVTVEADVFADGHEQLGVELQWRAIDSDAWNTAPMEPLGNDRWTASFTLDRLGRYEFAVEGWIDQFGGFQRDFGKKRAAGVAQPVDEQEGRLLIEAARERAGGELKETLTALLARVDAEGAELLLSEEARSAMHAADHRPFLLRSEPQLVDSERLQARYASWYELFPRSITDSPDRHGTFDDVIGELPRIRAMGFDVLYFPPIHPIGAKHRKGRNNSLEAGPDDPGSPYAIGSDAGGHDAIHPELGTFEDFRRLIRAAAEHGLEIALDFAVQCSPDHPWLKQHPGWFDWRPDGTIKYAENPPKKYQDIVNVDFYRPDAVPDLWCALRDIVLLWVREGVKTFRVDNPHTKPLPFWEWMIREVRSVHPDTIFLAEAFTRPKVMYRLAKIGFSQSYTYFTWRNEKAELADYLIELNTTAPKEFFRPHFFVNTPDINPPFLQTSGPAGFKIRAALAATLSGLFGVYSGFELCEWEPVPGKEEYLDSEKYEIRPRDWTATPNIIADITLLNRLRKGHPALQTHLGTRFYNAYNDRILYFGKGDPASGEMILVAISLDPHGAQEAGFELPLWEFGLGDDGALAAEDLVRGTSFTWRGKGQFVRLTPDQPYAIWRVEPAQ